MGLSDFGALRAAFGSSSGDANYNAAIDCDTAGTIGLFDFGCLRDSFGDPPGPGGRGCELASFLTGEPCPAPNLPL